MIENKQNSEDAMVLPPDRDAPPVPAEKAGADLDAADTGVPADSAVHESEPSGKENSDEPPEAAGEEAALDIERLADEFLALAEEMPAIAKPEDLPEEVWDTAAQGVPLRDAYLRFWYSEWSRKQAAAAAQSRARAGSAGPLRDVPEDPRPEEAAFTRSFQSTVE